MNIKEIYGRWVTTNNPKNTTMRIVCDDLELHNKTLKIGFKMLDVIDDVDEVVLVINGREFIHKVK